VCIYSHRAADTILFYHQGGVDIGDVDAKAVKLDVPVNSTLSLADVKRTGARLTRRRTPVFIRWFAGLPVGGRVAWRSVAWSWPDWLSAGGSGSPHLRAR